MYVRVRVCVCVRTCVCVCNILRKDLSKKYLKKKDLSKKINYRTQPNATSK